MKAPDKIPFPLKAPLKKAGRPKGSTNKKQPDFPVSRSDIDRVKNVIARQDDLIAQLKDEVNDFKNKAEQLDGEVGLLEDKIESYREILKTLLEITE